MKGNSITGNTMKLKYQTRSLDMKVTGALLVCLTLLIFLCNGPVSAGTYLNSAHGSSASGVKRNASGFPSDYTKGHCAHCHEQHASIDGSEPGPSGGPANYSLFDTNHTSQTENFCFDCHTDVSSYQTGGSIVNRSYSYRAGAWISDSVNDIKEMFSSSPGTAHRLDDIKTFITGRWGYTADSNPCNACHNPHAAQGDPLGSDTAKASGTRGYPVSRPSLHNSKDSNAWGLWGDGAGEKMYDYASTSYQAPYRYYTATPTTLEPQGHVKTDPVSAAQSTTDFVAFCTDCHNNTNTIYSNTLGRNLYLIDWSANGDKHGGRQRNQNGDIYDKGELKLPFSDASSYILSCLDCHEPHGSRNAYLLRAEVNGVVVSNAISKDSNANGAWNEFCSACHNITVTEAGGSVCVAAGTPGEDHGPPFATSMCTDCHRHDGGLCPRTAGINETF